MRAGHGRAAQRLGGGYAIDSNTLHVDTGGKDVDEAPKVAERGARVGALVDGADGDGAFSRSGGVVGS